MQARFYKEVKPVSREWFVGCLVIELDDNYFYVNRGRQIEPLTKKTFDLAKIDLEPITREQAVALVPNIVSFLEAPNLPLIFSRRLGSRPLNQVKAPQLERTTNAPRGYCGAFSLKWRLRDVVRCILI